MKKLFYLIVLALILGLVLTGCSLLSNIGQAPATEQSGIAYLTKALPLADLVGLWHFDEGSGATTVADSSGYSNTGTIYGAIPGVAGKFGNALSFDVSDDYVDIGTTNLATGAHTVTFWAYSSDEGNVAFFEFQLDFLGFISYKDASGRVMCGHRGGVQPYTAVGTFPLNQWNHIALVYDGGSKSASASYKIYINGVDEATTLPYGAIGSSFERNYIGKERNWYYGSSILDEVRIWNTALMSNTIEDHYSEVIYGFNGLLPPYTEPPRAFKTGSSIPLKWQYTDAAGNVVDSSAADPQFNIVHVSGDLPVAGNPIVVEDPGNSGLRYDIGTDRWIFNWQTKDWTAGVYNISIISVQTGQANGPFPIQLK